MSKQLIDLGSSPNKGDGDPLRNAFRKINENFNELYAGNFAEPEQTASSLIPSANNEYDLGSFDNQWSDLHVSDFIYLSGARIQVTSVGALLINGGTPIEARDTIGSVFGDDSTLLVDGVSGTIPSTVIEGSRADNWDQAYLWGDHANAGYLTSVGDFTGSIFADDSSLLVDAVNGVIPGYVSIDLLKAEVAASTDFPDFQARISAL